MLKKDNEKREIEFDLEYLTSLSREQRFKKFFGMCDFVMKLAEDHGYGKRNRKTAQIIQRKCKKGC